MKKKILYAIFVICIVFIAGCGTKENKEKIAMVSEKTIGDELSIESENEIDDNIIEVTNIHAYVQLWIQKVAYSIEYEI